MSVDGDAYTGRLSYSEVNRNGPGDLTLRRNGTGRTYTVRDRTETRAPQSILPE